MQAGGFYLLYGDEVSGVDLVLRRLMVNALLPFGAHGFEVIYGHTDSLFVKKHGATREEYARLAQTIGREAELRTALDHHKFLVLLLSASDPQTDAANRYFRKLADGDLHYRGLELRRRDYPPFLTQFEMSSCGSYSKPKARRRL